MNICDIADNSDKEIIIEEGGCINIHSPNYPRTYPSSTECNVTISSRQVDGPLYVDFDHFKIEWYPAVKAGGGSYECPDYLLLNQTDTESYQKLCGPYKVGNHHLPQNDPC